MIYVIVTRVIKYPSRDSISYLFATSLSFRDPVSFDWGADSNYRRIYSIWHGQISILPSTRVLLPPTAIAIAPPEDSERPGGIGIAFRRCYPGGVLRWARRAQRHAGLVRPRLRLHLRPRSRSLDRSSAELVSSVNCVCALRCTGTSAALRQAGELRISYIAYIASLRAVLSSVVCLREVGS